jgi:hypothetical protein
VEHREDGAVVSEATVKLRVRGERVIATAEGNGPVNALDQALRQALTRHYPQLSGLELADYKVRILAGSHGTDAVTRVLVETVDEHGRDWTTVGVHENVGRGELARPGRRAELRPDQGEGASADVEAAGVHLLAVADVQVVVVIVQWGGQAFVDEHGVVEEDEPDMPRRAARIICTSCRVAARS